MITRRSTGFLPVLVAILALAPSLFAASAKTKSGDTSKQSSVKQEQAAVPADGSDAAAGAETRFSREYPALAKMLNHDATNLPIVRMPDGAEKLDLQGGFRSVMIVYTTPAGERVVTCIASLKAAEKIFAPKAADLPKEP